MEEGACIRIMKGGAYAGKFNGQPRSSIQTSLGAKGSSVTFKLAVTWCCDSKFSWNPRMIAEYPQYRAPLHMADANANSSQTCEFSEMLESIRGTLDLMLSKKRCARGPSRESALGSSQSGEEEEEMRNALSPKILTLLDELDSCMSKLKYSEEGPEPKPEASPPSRCSMPNPTNDNLLAQTFGRRRSNLIPSRDRQGSLVSMGSHSTLASTTASGSRTSSLAPTTQAGVAIAEAQLGCSQRGWLSKLYVSHPTFLPRKTWKKRFFVLNGATLYRFKTNADGATSSEAVHFTPAYSVCVTDDFAGKKFVLQLTDAGPGTALHLMAESSEDLSMWLTAFKEAIVRARFEHESLPPSPDPNRDSYGSVESRRSSSQTLPTSFQSSPDPADLALARLARANSQPAVQSFHLASSDPSKRPVPPTSSPLASPPLAGRLGTHGRGRQHRLPPSNNSRRPSLAPLHEQEADDSDFLKDVLSPFHQRNSTFLGLFAAKH
ncbi:hypothetical protein L0F63_006167 [Massospora cicadina]|nr:hypothetical protein L0F63_006167 [Massospora cicadina]